MRIGGSVVRKRIALRGCSSFDFPFQIPEEEMNLEGL
jgi:hypothetical protein